MKSKLNVKKQMLVFYIAAIIMFSACIGITTAQTVDIKVSTPPVETEYFYGTVTINGLPAPDGTPVSAWINGVEKDRVETEMIGNEAWYIYLKVVGREGDLVIFKIYDKVVDNETFVDCKWTMKNLTAIFPPPEYKISGYVKYECNGTGIADANVTFGNGIPKSNNTDENGYYEFMAPADECNLTASKGDVLKGGKNVTFIDNSSTVNLTGDMTNVNLTVAIKGDLNGDCEIDMNDVHLAAGMVIGTEEPPLDLRKADFNGNGYVDVGDAAKLLGYVRGGVERL